jgi:hypothetical protein
MISGQLPTLHSPHVLQHQFHTAVEHLDGRMLCCQMFCHCGESSQCQQGRLDIQCCMKMACSFMGFGDGGGGEDMTAWYWRRYFWSYQKFKLEKREIKIMNVVKLCKNFSSALQPQPLTTRASLEGGGGATKCKLQEALLNRNSSRKLWQLMRERALLVKQPTGTISTTCMQYSVDKLCCHNLTQHNTLAVNRWFAAQPKEFFLDGLNKIEQQSHKCVELRGGICRVNTVFNPVACCFLHKAKD